MSDRFALAPGLRLQEYVIEDVLGFGGFGITYRATDLALKSTVAIKEYFPSSLAVRDNTSAVRSKSAEEDKDYRWGLRRFISEARTLAKFKHDNIVRVFRSFPENNTAYMVLEYVEGKNMESWLKDLGRSPTQEELDHITKPIIEALSLVHQENIFHRDVKPKNIYIRKEDSTPVLLDFGAARYAFSEHSVNTAAIVSRFYSPYECYSADPKMQGPWTDIYGMAATLYRAIRGVPPSEATNRVIKDDYEPLSTLESLEGKYRPAFLEAIDAGLAVFPKDRPQTISEWMTLLEARDSLRDGAMTAAKSLLITASIIALYVVFKIAYPNFAHKRVEAPQENRVSEASAPLSRKPSEEAIAASERTRATPEGVPNSGDRAQQLEEARVAAAFNDGTALRQNNALNTSQATESIARSASLKAIPQDFGNLTKSGGIIENAAKPEEHYHNARLFEQRGDYLNARQSYDAFFAFKLDFLDPHLRYQSFLSLQEGRAGAREIYSTLYKDDKRPLIEFARILLFDAPQRTEMLKAFVAANPDFAPAYYELSREFSTARKGSQSLGDKRAEFEAIETFQKLNSDGKFLKHFIDKELAANWLQDAETRGKALAPLKRSAGTSPITLSASRSDTDWLITLQMLEIPREIFYQSEGEDSFRSTGVTDAKNQETGFNMPNMYFSLKANTRKTKLQIKYTDVGNEIRGPYTLEFDPEKALVDDEKKILGQTKDSWVSFRDLHGKLLVYFTQVLSSRCAIKEIAYGINSASTPSLFEVPECNAKDPFSVPSKIFVEVPNNSQYLTVQLTYKDGTKSEAIRFDR